MLHQANYEQAYTCYLQAHHITHKVIPHHPKFQRTMQSKQEKRSEVREVYQMLLGFFGEREGQRTLRELERKMEEAAAAAAAAQTETETEKDETEAEKETDVRENGQEVEQPPPQSNGYEYTAGPASPSTPTDHEPPQPGTPAPPPPAPASPSLHLPITNVINAEVLDRYMRSFPAHILILDVRPRDQFDRGRFPSKNVVCIDPYFLQSPRNGVSTTKEEARLRQALSISPAHEQQLYDSRGDFELVVIHDWDSPALASPHGESSAQQLCLQQLVDIIYNNAFKTILKRAPCLLVGGLAAWVEYTGDTLWKRQVRTSIEDPPPPPPPPPPHAAPLPPVPAPAPTHEFKTPQMPRGIPSRDGSRKGSVVSVHSTGSMDGSIGAARRQSLLRDDYFGASAGTLQSNGHGTSNGSVPEYLMDHGIVRPKYSHMSPAAIPTTAPAAAAAAATPPPSFAYSPNQQQQYYNQQPPQQQHQQPRPPLAAYPQQRMSMPAIPSKATYGDMRYSDPPNMGAPPPPVPRQMMAPQPPPNQFYEFATGLVNLGNTCYMNCILQCLVGTARLSEMFLNGEYQVQLESKLGYQGHLAHVYARLVRAMYQAALQAPRGQLAYIAPKEMKFLSGRLSASFSGYEQQDCHEFLNFLLDGLHEDLNMRGNKPGLKPLTELEEAKREAMNVHEASLNEWMRHLFNNESPVSRHCQGQYLSRLECRVCGTTSTTYNPFSCLSIPIPSRDAAVTLEDCFKLFTRPELLDCDDAWFCPKCKRRQPTVKTMRLSRLPDFLIVHLKRFKHAGGIWGSNKLGTYVRYPVRDDLDLQPHWLPSAGMQHLPEHPGASGGGGGGGGPGQQQQRLPYQSPPFRYRLYGVANHFGTLKGGHYTAYVKRGKAFGWCHFDDTRVRVRVSPEEVVNKNAYVLFYERV